MKKIILFVFLTIFSLNAFTVFAVNSDTKSQNPAVPDKKENKLSEEEISRLTKRVEEIRDMDKSKLTASEKRDLRKELKGIKEKARNIHGGIYIGAGTLIIIILLIILLL